MESPPGFEGVEKRLEIVFKKQPIGDSSSLRSTLTEDLWNIILQPVDCRIEYSLLSHSVDTYLLSASSLFVFDHRVVIKTCGNTKIFEAIPLILFHSKKDPLGVKFTRGTYRWPENQPLPHQSFETEGSELSQLVPLEDVIVEKLGCVGETFHVIAATTDLSLSSHSPLSLHSTVVEILMTGLDKSTVFFQDSGSGPMFSASSGIDKIFPGVSLSQVCDMEFPGCGYSMNGVLGDSVYTIHVTPEEAFSFASFELCHYDPNEVDLGALIESVIGCFSPSNFIVAIVGCSESSQELKVSRVVRWRETKQLGAWGNLECYFF